VGGELTGFEADFFRALNMLVEPVVRAGCGSPGLWPTGLVVVETRGEKTGRPHRVPLMATVWDGCVFVSTVRGQRSQWARNLAADPAARYWLSGRERQGRALLFASGAPAPATDRLPPLARAVAERLLAPAVGLGWTFVVIVPDREPTT